MDYDGDAWYNTYALHGVLPGAFLVLLIFGYQEAKRRLSPSLVVGWTIFLSVVVE